MGSGIKEKYVFQKMGVPFRQMHSWDYSGPYHGYDGFAIFARDMDMAINSPVWGSPRPRGKPRRRPGRHNFQEKAVMTQSATHVLDHFDLFRQPEYKEMLENKKKNFENPVSAEEVERIREWTKTGEYRDKNFAREALTINPAKACQPLGAVFAAVGFEGTLPFVHGSQGCVAYYRSHFSRHFKEPTSCVSSSMTEDAAVFGGLNNMVDGLANAYSLYKPKMIAVSTTCMAEVIGDDLNAFIKGAKEKGSVPVEFNVPFAHTPAFVGSHITGYDNVMKGICEHFWDGKAGTAPKLERAPDETINFIGGFDGYTVGNLREIKRIFGLMGLDYTILGDNSDVWDTPTDGEFRMYDGGTTLEEAADALHAKASISMQEYCTEKTLAFIGDHGQEVLAFNHPVGVAATDRFLMEVARVTGKAIPEELAKERGRVVVPSRIRARISTARSSRSTAIRICVSDSRDSYSSWEPSRLTCSPPTAARRGRKRSGHCSTVRRSAKTAMSTRARTYGICVRCCSPNRWTSSSATPTASSWSATRARR